MRLASIKTNLTILLSASMLTLPAFATRTHRTATSSTAHGTSHLRTTTRHAAPKPAHRLHGQQAIEPARVTEIQQALVREHYLSSEPNGQWDATTEAAMQKFQADQGWQTKLMPDSRALKKLGLGPDYSSAINAKTSTFADPPPASTIPQTQAAGFSASSGVH
jgi:peptidoglycan hydrolase-like protein with peptidoglycan-binding domain